ncbi:MAG TPA: sulfurtransferase TusA family protein [Anaerolineales bacterium]|nr:sulfurtransferase TusA family protein [Anaerolineales bacterium]
MTQTADQVLDCSGLSCPMPVVKTSKAIKGLEIGQVLKMISTDPGSQADMEAWSRQTGHALLSSVHDGDKFIYLIQRSK